MCKFTNVKITDLKKKKLKDNEYLHGETTFAVYT